MLSRQHLDQRTVFRAVNQRAQRFEDRAYAPPPQKPSIQEPLLAEGFGRQWLLLEYVNESSLRALHLS